MFAPQLKTSCTILYKTKKLLFIFRRLTFSGPFTDDHKDDESYRISVGVHAEEAFGGRVPGAGIGGIQDAVGSASGSVTRRLRISP